MKARQTETERQTERQRQTETERDTKRDTDRETEREVVGKEMESGKEKEEYGDRETVAVWFVFVLFCTNKLIQSKPMQSGLFVGSFVCLL